MKKILFVTILLVWGTFFAQNEVANAACCSTNCSTVESSCSPENWFANLDCSQMNCPTASSTTTTPAGAVTPTSTSQTTTAAGSSSAIFPNPLGSVTTVSALLSSIMTNLMGIIAIISLIFIILGGLMYMLSAGNEAMVTRAKKTWTGAVIGLAIAMAAPTFLKTIQTILGGNSSPNGNADAWVSGALTLKDIAVNVLNLLLSLVGVIAMISMIIGGLMYLTAAGDEKRIDKGKEIFKNSIIGIIVALSALVVIRQVSALLGA